MTTPSTLDDAHLATRRITRLSVDGPAGEPVQADGDTIATLPVTFSVAAERLTIFVAPRHRA